ncbi:DNA-binding LacI/PurR family transcriptional regulator [Actinoplanes octamycinicus]|uniref:DNA-binding LacI/PurR family transcriptional regulator n=1 Tax=Actinoplanes octamycinicus TaxID=135948 RepID=A0A7W7H4F8_9ACTN|nr:DNA-binding LacI/PurR family transcriptional regulator [Actinoplanes octamycinicus]
MINTPDIVRAETRARVREAITALGYRVNRAARQMRTGRSRLIAVRIEPARDGINGSVLDRFLHGLTDAAAPAGYRVMLYTAADDAEEIATYDDLLTAHDLDGFVLTSTHHGDPRTSWLAARDVPFVTFGRPWGAPETHAWVDVDNAAGTEAATSRLLATGHRRIGFVGWPAGSGVGDARREGWARTLASSGPDAPACLDDLAVATVDGIDTGAAAARDLLTRPVPPTALVCASDSLALGALAAARELGRYCAVVGFDDTAVAQAVGLTSVSQPLAAAAARCMDLLAEILDGGGPATPARALLQPSLVLRQTA